MVADQNKVRTRINLEDDWEVFANANIGRLNAKHNSKFTKALNTAPIANSTTFKGNTVKCLEVKLSKVWQFQTLMMDVCALKSETSLTKYIATLTFHTHNYSLFVEWGHFYKVATFVCSLDVVWVHYHQLDDHLVGQLSTPAGVSSAKAATVRLLGGANPDRPLLRGLWADFEVVRNS